MNTLELVKSHEAIEKGLETSEFLIKFGSIMERIEDLKYLLPQLHSYPENQIDLMIENCETYVTKFSKEFKGNKKYSVFAEELEDYFLNSAIETKENWSKKRK